MLSTKLSDFLLKATCFSKIIQQYSVIMPYAQRLSFIFPGFKKDIYPFCVKGTSKNC